MKLSIIIPYYNGEQYIKDVLDDLLEQDIGQDDFEIIIVDDGSTHQTETIDSYSKTYSQITCYRQVNQGVSAARNTGISHAKGEYIFFCDCDDRVRRNVIGHLYAIASMNHLDMLFFDYQTTMEKITSPQNIGELEKILTGIDYYAQNPDMRMECWRFLIKKAFVEKYHLSFPEHIIYHEDVVFLVNALLVAVRVSHINCVLYYYLQRPQSAIHYSAKILKASKVADNRMWIIGELLNVLSQHSELLCRNSLLQRVRMLSFQMLHHSFRYLSVRRNKELIYQLRQLGAYPFDEGRYLSKALHITYVLMQIYPLWMACCCFYHILPLRIRERF